MVGSCVWKWFAIWRTASRRSMRRSVCWMFLCLLPPSSFWCSADELNERGEKLLLFGIEDAFGRSDDFPALTVVKFTLTVQYFVHYIWN